METQIMEGNKMEPRNINGSTRSTFRDDNNGSCKESSLHKDKMSTEDMTASENNCEALTKKFQELIDNARKRGIHDEIIYKAFTEPNIQNVQKPKSDHKKIRRGLLLGAIVALMLSIILAFLVKYQNIDEEISRYVKDIRCVLENNGFVIEIVRPKTNCTPCHGVSEVPIVYNISKEDFLDKFAYTNRPVLVKHATSEWTAMHTFSFKFFQELYNTHNGSYEAIENECQFFPYNTEFETLEDAFKMSDARAEFREGEKHWYFGWSNCHKEVAAILRKHYQKPYFLPSDSESSHLDWIFMGGQGRGAFIHLDFVQRPSWQAQISGSKTWTLIPTPECESVCNTMNVTVHKGDIIVLDTNQWYHATFIHTGDISITIGSEYD